MKSFNEALSVYQNNKTKINRAKASAELNKLEGQERKNAVNRLNAAMRGATRAVRVHANTNISRMTPGSVNSTLDKYKMGKASDADLIYSWNCLTPQQQKALNLVQSDKDLIIAANKKYRAQCAKKGGNCAPRIQRRPAVKPVAQALSGTGVAVEKPDIEVNVDGHHNTVNVDKSETFNQTFFDIDNRSYSIDLGTGTGAKQSVKIKNVVRAEGGDANAEGGDANAEAFIIDNSKTINNINIKIVHKTNHYVTINNNNYMVFSLTNKPGYYCQPGGTGTATPVTPTGGGSTIPGATGTPTNGGPVIAPSF